MKLNIDKFLSVIVALCLPFVLLMGSVRAVMTPLFPKLEYVRPGFPADIYGFSTEERTKWSGYAVRYLTNDADISYLGDLRFENGSSLYRQSELDHMQDVKDVVRISLLVWYGLLGLLFGVVIWFLANQGIKKIARALRSGAWISLGLVFGIIILLAINFNRLFEEFHRLFFSEGSWLFYVNDTLIRLFPMDFWRDAFLLVFLLVIMAAVVILRLTRFSKGDQS